MKQEILCSKLKLLLLSLSCLLAGTIIYAQQGPSPEVRKILEHDYKQIKSPEISLEKFIQINSHVFKSVSGAALRQGVPALSAAAAAAPQDVYCSKVSAYCTNGDFESGLDQNAYNGAYGFFYESSLYPDPFAPSGFGSISFGFSSGSLNSSAAHQTIVNKTDGNDPNVPIPMVPANGGNKALRLGNAVTGYGFEILAKTIKVDASETILSFYYALVLQDPGHPHDQQPAFSVRAYDCATGQELPNVCDLGNGTNIAVSDANNPFFKSAGPTFNKIAYRDWSLAQINLSKYVGKTVIIVFTNKDCAQGGHYGYTYLDNLFSSHCPGGVIPTDQGSVSLDITKTTDCGTGNICVKYSLPKTGTTTGDATIILDVYQNGSVVKTLTSPKFTSGSSYCFSINPASLGLNNTLGGFDYVLTGKFNLSGFALSPIVVGNPPSGQKAGNNNDYMINCTQANTYYSKPTGDLHNTASWGVNMDGSGANPPDFGAGKTFNLANRSGNYTMTGNWTVGGLIVNPSGSQLKLNGFTLTEAGMSGAGTLTGTATSNLVVNGFTGAGTLNFTSGGGMLKNFTLLNNAKAALGTNLDIYGVLSIQNGMFNTGNKLTLKSTATTTAIVSAVGGTITDMVTIERYIPARRAWRMINAPLSGSQTIMAAWQEGATTASPNPNPNPGYGTHITGGPVYGTLANGFDQHPGSNTSIQWYNNAVNNWQAVPNTNVMTVGNKVFMLFIRGNRGLVLDGPNLPPNNTTLRVKGNLLTGNQMYTVNASGYTAITNPYQSPINFATLTRTNVANSFYVWDPKMGGTYGVGAYVTVSWNGSSYDVTPAATSPESQYIQPWQSFLVRSTGSAGSITIKETDKVSTPINNVYRTTGNGNDQTSSITANAVTLKDAPVGQSLRINLQTTSEDNTPALLDEVLTTYSVDYSNSVDGLDATKMMNIGENLAINHQGQSLSIERRHDLSGNDTIQLQLSNTAQRSYLLQFTPLNLSPARYSAYLEDSYLQTLTPIDLEGSSQHAFTINDDAASQSPSRFKVLLLLGKSQFDVLASSGQSTITAYPNPVSGNTLRLQLINQPKGTYRIALVNSAGQIVYNSQMEHSGGSAIKLLRLSHKLAGGIYQLQVVHGQQRTSLKVVANQ